MIENEQQHFALAPRQQRQCALQKRTLLGVFDAGIGGRRRLAAGFFHAPAQRQKIAKSPPPPMIGGGPVNDAEQPGTERRAPVESSPSVENFQVSHLQHLFCLAAVAPAAVIRPRMGGAVVNHQLAPQLALPDLVATVCRHCSMSRLEIAAI